METLRGNSFAAMVQNGYKAIKLQYVSINDLNVFPVPDGDTGTNMTATMNGGIKAMEKANMDDLSDVASKLASGMLLGARGNSGVILSQFFAGVADGFAGLESANLTQVASALRSGVNKAYKAVIKPVEGTILTVAREGCTYALDHIEELHSLEELFHTLLRKMRASLKKTPDLLPVLKEAGVVDSGGAGLVAIMEGMYKHLTGEELEDSFFDGPSNAISGDADILFNADSVLEYGYCTEFIMQLLNDREGPKNFVLQDMIDYYSTLGDSIVAVENNGIVKVHVHTKTPGKVIEYAQRYGEFVTFKMENMSIQHQEVLLKELEEEQTKKPLAMVAVASSAPLAELFLEMGVNQIVKGGQTMNPSAEDFVHAIENCNAENVIVFPNNGNVILTAKQAAEMVAGVNVIVIETKSVIECYSALGMVDLENQTLERNLELIKEQIEGTVSAEVSIAVRDSVNNGLKVEQGDYIGISKGKMCSVDKTLLGCTMKLLRSIEDIDGRSIITVFYGEDAKDEDRAALRKAVQEEYPLMDFIEVEGHQTIYPFVLAVE
ncbi:MAG: DAK2 domain-containing protein [Erysipelotrichaceae bacterium]|nr:DAK2 domain-containing protein [Erysipelotrichaceae bacterium]